MSADDDAKRHDVPFGPPAVPIEVHCLHCREAFESWQMEVRNEGPDNDPAWCCPTPGCNGLGFLFDIWPVDPEWRDEHGELVCHQSDHDEESFDFEGVVDSAILDAYWSGDDHRTALPYRDHEPALSINVDGDEEHPLIRMFGDEARPRVPREFRDDDIPF